MIHICIDIYIALLPSDRGMLATSVHIADMSMTYSPCKLRWQEDACVLTWDSIRENPNRHIFTRHDEYSTMI